jgi:hypothetical protein
MLRRTRLAQRKQLKDNLTYQTKSGNTRNTGFSTPYQNWQHKQNELFRGTFEDQTLHLRKVYAKQYYEAYISNAEEYVSKYSVTKAATLAEWEANMESQEKSRRDEFEKQEGRKMLKHKHYDLIREKRERQFFHWYERASERLQYMDETFKWVTRDNLDAHLEAELDKYQLGESPEETKAKHYPLNFIGQMPYLEDRDLSVVSAPNRKAASHFNASGAPPGSDPIGVFEPTSLERDGSAMPADAVEAPISGAVRSLDDDVVSQVVDAMADEAVGEEIDTIDPAAEGSSDVERRGSLRATIERSQHGLKEVDFADRRADPTATGRSPTLAETKQDVAAKRKQQAAAKKRREKRGGSAAQRRQEELQRKNLASLDYTADGSAPSEDAKKARKDAAAADVDVTDPNYVDPKTREKQAARKLREERRAISDERLAESKAFSTSKGMKGMKDTLRDRDVTGAKKNKDE